MQHSALMQRLPLQEFHNLIRKTAEMATDAGSAQSKKAGTAESYKEEKKAAQPEATVRRLQIKLIF